MKNIILKTIVFVLLLNISLIPIINSNSVECPPQPLKKVFVFGLVDNFQQIPRQTSITSRFVIALDFSGNSEKIVNFYTLGEVLNIVHDDPEDINILGRFVWGFAIEIL